MTAVESVTLDGVLQAPGRADEDTRDGFAHGGWATQYTDEVMGRTMGERMASGSGSLLLGRRTYEDFHGHWPKQKDNPYTDQLNRSRKLVASRTLCEPLPWQNSELLPGDAVDAVRALDERLTVLGSGELVRALLRAGLVDELLLLIHPLVLGSGRRLLGDGEPVPLELAGSVVTGKGVVIATFTR